MPFSLLASDVDALMRGVARTRDAILADWHPWLVESPWLPSAANLAAYLALRQQDLRPLQQRLAQTGLSSLGRCEAHVMPTLEAVHGLLQAAAGRAALAPVERSRFESGQRRIGAGCEALFGALSAAQPVRVLVTLPTEAAEAPEMLVRLAQAGVQAVRINTAHDDEAVWGEMVAHARRAATLSGRPMKVLMDLPGPKIRSGPVREAHGRSGSRVAVGEELALVLPGQLEEVPARVPALTCRAPEVLALARVGDRVLIDDGQVATVVVAQRPWGLLLRVEAGPDDKGWKLKPEKGLAFPDTDLAVPALTADDRRILRFAARHADGIEFSFVQTPEDVADLQAALADLRPQDWQQLGLVLKVETRRAVRHLPQMIVRAAARQPTAVMIARGDLAVEIGFARVAEMQEEILWLCEAAHVPVVWATQVMEHHLKTGVPLRGEMTDAAMGARAECVMLNKGPHLFDTLALLDGLFARMAGHVSKKSHLLRPLQAWALDAMSPQPAEGPSPVPLGG